jgi:hypothetical protein
MEKEKKLKAIEDKEKARTRRRVAQAGFAIADCIMSTILWFCLRIATEGYHSIPNRQRLVHNNLLLCCATFPNEIRTYLADSYK